jgi:hypothetical protein
MESKEGAVVTMFGGSIRGPGVSRSVGQVIAGALFWELLRQRRSDDNAVGLDHEQSELSGRITGERLLELIGTDVELDYDGELRFLLERIRPDRSYGVTAWEL